MARPAVLDAIDEALAHHLPAGVKVAAETAVLAAVLQADGVTSPLRQPVYRGVTINRSLAHIDGGWAVRVAPGFEKPAEQPRDPETGRFMSYEDAANG